MGVSSVTRPGWMSFRHLPRASRDRAGWRFEVQHVAVVLESSWIVWPAALFENRGRRGVQKTKRKRKKRAHVLASHGRRCGSVVRCEVEAGALGS
jgi:hypothetical protein